MQTLKLSDLIALGFMTFALFLGAGNIIFPPLVGLLAGDDMWPAALGFLLTGVGLPLLTIVALARVGGNLDDLTAPVGRVAGIVFGFVVYLTIGPLFAGPRTATVSFEIGLAPFVSDSPLWLFVYSLVYFGLVLFISLNPMRLIDSVGKILTPLLLIALVMLGGAALFWPAGSAGPGSAAYAESPIVQGFLQGYQTMDALGALVFGIVVLHAIRGLDVSDPSRQTHYAIWAGIIAAIGLCAVYLSLIYLGASSGGLSPEAQTGVPLLAAFARYAFGPAGGVLLAAVVMLACLTTAVGLMTACGAYFSQILAMSYRRVVVLVCGISMVVANLGLAQLIKVSIPVLVAVYPVAITLVMLSLMSGLWRSPSRVFVPALSVATSLGIIDGLKVVELVGWVPEWVFSLPASSLGLGWLVPVVVATIAGALSDRFVFSSRH